MHVLHLFPSILIFSITSAWPHPTEVLDTFLDPYYVEEFDMLAWPTSTDPEQEFDTLPWHISADPGQESDTFPWYISADPGQEFDILTWPTTAEQDLALAEPAQCPTDGNTAKPEDAETVEKDPVDPAGKFSPEIDLFRVLDIVETPRKAPPCGPNDNHYKVCCLNVLEYPLVLMKCMHGRFDFFPFFQKGREEKEREQEKQREDRFSWQLMHA
jgi:hypothetical protein